MRYITWMTQDTYIVHKKNLFHERSVDFWRRFNIHSPHPLEVHNMAVKNLMIQGERRWD